MANTFKFGNGEWAVGKETVLAYNDENNNFKPLPFTFDRGSIATVVNSDGLIETVGIDQPRIDFLNNTKGHLLLEPQRQNELPNSNVFSGYSLSNVAIIENNTTSPDGSLNATKIYPTSSGNYRHIKYNAVSPASGLYTFSIFAKADELSHLVLVDYDGAGIGIDFDLSTGIATDNATVAFDSFDMIDYGNGWYRCSATATDAYFYWILSDDGGVSVTASGTNGLYIYGAQAEAGSYATSYIPTSGSAVTRSAESCSQTLPSAVPTSGVMYAEIELFDSVLDTSSTAIRYGINQTIYSGNWIFFGIESGDNLRVYIRANDSTSFDYTSNNVFPTAGVYKIAMRFAPNDTKVFVNGVQKASSESTVIASNLNNLNLSGGGIVPSIVNNSVKNRDFRLYNTALTDAELIALTTI